MEDSTWKGGPHWLFACQVVIAIEDYTLMLSPKMQSQQRNIWYQAPKNQISSSSIGHIVHHVIYIVVVPTQLSDGAHIHPC